MSSRRTHNAIHPSVKARINQGMAIFAKFIQNKKLIIADESMSVRSALMPMLIQMGFKTQNIVMTPNYDTAMDIVKQVKPEIIITDFELMGKCGLDLFRAHRACTDPNRYDQTLFVMFTSNRSVQALGQIADSEVDLLMFKPFTLENIKKSLIQAVLVKSNADVYMRKVYELRQYIELGEVEMAMDFMRNLQELDQSKCFALIVKQNPTHLENSNKSKSKTETLKTALKSQDDYAFYRYYYKAIQDLYDVSVKLNQHESVYLLGKMLMPYLAGNQDRFASFLKAASAIGDYSDMEEFYELFKLLENRTQSLSKTMAVALMMSGKSLVDFGMASSNVHIVKHGIDVLAKATKAGLGWFGIHAEVIRYLLLKGLPTEAQEFMSRMSESDKSGPEFQVLNLRLMDQTAKDNEHEFVIAEARKLITNNLANEEVFKIAIERSLRLGRDRLVENFVYKAVEVFASDPVKKAKFLSYLDRMKDGKSKAS